MNIVTSVEFVAFAWSIFLYFAAVVFKGRRQESGLVFAVLGLVAFVGLYCDKLPWADSSARHPLTWIGASSAHLRAGSPVWPAIAIAVLYALRFMVYYELLSPGGPPTEESVAVLPSPFVAAPDAMEDENDLVAPPLSFATFAAAAGPLAAIALGTTQWLGVGLFLVLEAAYYGVAIYRKTWAVIRATARAFLYVFVSAWIRVRRLCLKVILLIARAEIVRRGTSTGDLRMYDWATRRLGELGTELATARAAWQADMRRVRQPADRSQPRSKTNR